MSIEIYSTQTCTYCVRAKTLLQSKGLAYTETDVTEDLDKVSEMIERSGRQTVPQIFIDGDAIGGFLELASLNATGRLV